MHDGNPMLSQILAGHMQSPGFRGFTFAPPGGNFFKDPAKTAAVNARRRRAYVNAPDQKKHGNPAVAQGAPAAPTAPSAAKDPPTSPATKPEEKKPLLLTPEEMAARDRREVLELLAKRAKRPPSPTSNPDFPYGEGYRKSISSLFPDMVQRQMDQIGRIVNFADGIAPPNAKQETRTSAPSEGGMNVPVDLKDFEDNEPPSQTFKTSASVPQDKDDYYSHERIFADMRANLQREKEEQKARDERDRRRALIEQENNRRIAEAMSMVQQAHARRRRLDQYLAEREAETQALADRGPFERLGDAFGKVGEAVGDYWGSLPSRIYNAVGTPSYGNPNSQRYGNRGF